MTKRNLNFHKIQKFQKLQNITFEHLTKSVKSLCVCAVVTSTFSCGDNAFEKTQTLNDKEIALKSMQKKDFSSAEKHMKLYCNTHPEDTTCPSLLARIQLQKAGISELALAAKIGLSASTDSSSDLSTLLAAMPSANSENIEALRTAVLALESKSAQERSNDENFQLAFANVALAFTVTKGAVGNESNGIDGSKIALLTEEQAIEIVTSLNSAVSSLKPLSESSKFYTKLASVENKINEKQGSNTKEKLQAYLLENQSISK